MVCAEHDPDLFGLSTLGYLGLSKNESESEKRPLYMVKSSISQRKTFFMKT